VVDWQPRVQVLQWLELPLPPDLPPLAYDLVVGLEDRGVGQSLGPAVELSTITPSVATTPVIPEKFSVPNPGDTTAGGLLSLRGYSLDPRFLQPGGTTLVTLYWQAQGTPGVDYVLALWLADLSGRQVLLTERLPLDGDYPTSLWNAGQWVRDRFELSLPPDFPSGQYQVFIGWRDPTGTWLIVGDQVGISLGEVYVADH
jgi:hypothetical protein